MSRDKECIEKFIIELNLSDLSLHNVVVKSNSRKRLTISESNIESQEVFPSKTNLLFILRSTHLLNGLTPWLSHQILPNVKNFAVIQLKKLWNG